MNIIALDIDDAILPSDSNYFGSTDDSLELLEINLKRLCMICDKYDMEIFITSDWSNILSLDGKNIQGKEKFIYKNQISQLVLLKKYLDGRVIGLSCGSRKVDIETLLIQKHKVVIIDDMNLQFLDNEDENCLFCKTIGYISGNIGYKIHIFMERGEKDEKI